MIAVRAWLLAFYFVTLTFYKHDNNEVIYKHLQITNQITKIICFN